MPDEYSIPDALFLCKKSDTMQTMKKVQKLITVVGPTASGKSDLAVMIARAVGGEVVSADSRQVYTDLDLGTGKITRKEMRGVPHHLLDVASPKRTFTVAQYKKLAERSIADIIDRGNVPILCGGTGFYVQAIVDDLQIPNVPPNVPLRKTLSKKTVAELFAILTKLDPDRAYTIDAKNPVRLIRAIEIAQALGSVPKLPTKPADMYDMLIVGILPSDAELRARIHKRLLARMRQGMLAEAKRLHIQGLSWKRMEDLGLEYRYLARHLQGKLTKKEMLEELENAIWQYAKRQKTWFKRDKRIVWITPAELKKITPLATQFLKS